MTDVALFPYWVSFSDQKPGCIEAESPDEAKQVGDKLGAVTTIERLPYPANPRLGERSETPSFCYEPRKCAGWTSCPQRYSCVE